MNQLILAISLRGVIFRFYYSYDDGLAVYVKEGLPFLWDLSLENSADSYLCFRLALLHSVSLCMVFDSISYHIDDALSINPSAIVLSLETLTPIIRLADLFWWN